MGLDRPKLIETNVFGQLLDFQDVKHVDFRMFITLTSGMQAFKRTRIKDIIRDPGHYSVLYYPMPNSEGRTLSVTVNETRSQLGIDPTECLIIRIGRPGHKWTRWECEAFAIARKQNSLLRLYLMEPDRQIVDSISKGNYGDGIIVAEATSDQDYLTQLYKAADIMLHASRFGESFGYTIAEAMSASLPVITGDPLGRQCADRAEIMPTDFVCGSVGGMAAAILELGNDSALRKRMGNAGCKRIHEISSISTETDLLEEIIGFVSGLPKGSLMKKRYALWKDYIDSGYRISANKRFEKDRGLSFHLLNGKILQWGRCAGNIRRFIKLKLAGRKVDLPTL